MRSLGPAARLRIGTGLVLAGVVLVVAGCGSSSKSSVCSSRDDLRSSVDSLLKVNPAKDGLNEVSSRLGDERDRTSDLAKAAGDQYKPQVDTLQASTTRLSTTLNRRHIVLRVLWQRWAAAPRTPIRASHVPSGGRGSREDARLLARELLVAEHTVRVQLREAAESVEPLILRARRGRRGEATPWAW
jgi:hypothetical protein